MGAARGRERHRLARHPAGEDDRGDRARSSRSSTPSDERRTIATHEAGHAVVAYLVGKGRKLEVLSIIKRKDALGLLAHSDPRSASPGRGPRSIALDPDRLRRHGGRGAVLRRVRHRPGGDLAGGHDRSPRRWSARSAWPARCISYDAVEAGPVRAGDRRPRCSPTTRPARSVERILDEAKADVRTPARHAPPPRRGAARRAARARGARRRRDPRRAARTPRPSTATAGPSVTERRDRATGDRRCGDRRRPRRGRGRRGRARRDRPARCAVARVSIGSPDDPRRRSRRDARGAGSELLGSPESAGADPDAEPVRGRW